MPATVTSACAGRYPLDGDVQRCLLDPRAVVVAAVGVCSWSPWWWWRLASAPGVQGGNSWWALLELVAVVPCWLRVCGERGCCGGPWPSLCAPNNGALPLWWVPAPSVYPPVCGGITLQPLQAVSAQPTPVISPGLSSEA